MGLKWLPRMRRVPASTLLLVPGLLLLITAAVQAVRTARAQQETVSSVLESYARVAAWNFEQQVVPLVLEQVLEPLFHPLHMVSFEAGTVPPMPIERLLTERDLTCKMCQPLPPPIRYGVRLFVRSDAVTASIPLPDSVLQTIAAEVRGHVLERPQARLSMQDGLHVFTLNDSAVAAFYHGKTLPGDTVIYALIGAPGEVLAPVLDQLFATHSLLPDPLLRGTSSNELLTAAIETADGELIYGPFLRGPHIGDRVLPKLGGLTVRVKILDGAEQHLILGGARALSWPFLLALVSIALGLLVVALSQMRREQALAQLRSDFVSSVSHELRTPLALQRIFLDMLQLGRVDTPERRAWCFDNIDRESTRLAHLVENVLQFSRTERDAVRVTTQRTLLAPLLAEIVRAFEPLAAATRATLHCDFVPDISAPVDADALRQVMMNLLENAVKYGPREQCITVTLSLVHPGTARITVDDEGSGVPARERSTIFRPYRRGAATLNSAIAGSGIGLAVVHGLVHAHGGRTYVTDAPGGGARFVVELPDAQRDTPTSAHVTTVLDNEYSHSDQRA